MASPSLRNADFSDREILRIIHDLGDKEGWTDLEAIAEHIFPTSMNGRKARRTSALRCVATRLSWLKRFGVAHRRIVKDEDGYKHTQWNLTSHGYNLLTEKLTTKQRELIESVEDGRILDAAVALTHNYLKVDDVTANIVRRQWQHGQSRRRGY